MIGIKSQLCAGLALLAGAGAAIGACWVPDVDRSRLAFEIKQANAPLNGSFARYDACICLDVEDLSSASVRAEVETASVDTQLSKLDKALVGPDFFHSDRWPIATYQSDRIVRTGDGQFRAQGTLTIRDIPKPLSVPFRFRIPGEDQTATASGETTIKRLDYDLGKGEWADTRWVGNKVHITFDATLQRQTNGDRCRGS